MGWSKCTLRLVECIALKNIPSRRVPCRISCKVDAVLLQNFEQWRQVMHHSLYFYTIIIFILHHKHLLTISLCFFNRIIVVFEMNMVKADAMVLGDPPNPEDISLPNYYFSHPQIPLKRRLPPILSSSEYSESSNTRNADQYSFKKIRRCKSI